MNVGRGRYVRKYKNKPEKGIETSNTNTKNFKNQQETARETHEAPNENPIGVENQAFNR